MGSLADFNSLVINGAQRKAQLAVVFHFQKLRDHCHALANFGGGHMPHVDVSTYRLIVFIQVRRYQEHASVFHETNHRRRGEDIGRELFCPHLQRRHISLRMGESRHQSIFQRSDISQEGRELIPFVIHCTAAFSS